MPGTATLSRKTFAGGSGRALFLVAVGMLGLVVAPLVHAEEHHREQLEGEAEALAASWRAGSTDPFDALAFALEHVHERRRPKPREEHRHGHSHDPAGSGPHGSGTLAHLCIALHASPQLPEIASAEAQHTAPATVTGQLRGTLRYLVPEWSQGPPAGC